MEVVFHYDANKLAIKAPRWNSHSINVDYDNSPSDFDIFLLKHWNKATESGLFKYSLKDCCYKLLNKGSLQFVAQLNCQRGSKRRKHEVFDCMNAPFSNDQFNFTKIKNEEKLFILKPGNHTALGVFYNDFLEDDHVIAINVSPIDDRHILLIPQLSKCLPQKMTITSLLLAFDVIQLSNHPGFRVGFNSLYAWASINHLHFHAMYLDYPLFLDNHPANRNLLSNCFLLDKGPMPGFVFHIRSAVEERVEVAREAVAITDLLHEEKIPYNIMITRGECGTRMIIVPRNATINKTPSPCFDVACIEIGGQLPIKTKEAFDQLTFDQAYDVLVGEALTHDEFFTLTAKVKLKLS